MPSGLDRLDPHTPVVVGVAVRSQDAPAGEGVDALTLMEAALRAAGEDAGAPGLLADLDRIAVPGGNWSWPDPGRDLARAVGARGATTSLVRVGIPQQTLFDDAYRRVAAGEVAVAAVVGGEAARRSARARHAGIDLPDRPGDPGPPDDLQEPTGEIITAAEISGGLASPMAPFALLDAAVRAADGQTIAAHRDEIAETYAAFSRVAGGNPHAAFREPRTADAIREPGPDNRPFAFPYNKWHCAQMNVDQAGAVLITSLAAARAAGVERDRMVFPLVALESSHSLPVSARRLLHRWPAMEVLGAAAAAHLGHPLSDLTSVELYSCYPVAVRIQQRALGIDPGVVPTITGGEAFAGGPWNNFVVQTTVAMVEHLRARPGTRGLVTALSGLVNKPGLTVFSTEPDRPLIVADLGDAAATATPTAPVVTGASGSATVAAYTVLYDDGIPARVPAVLDLPDGTRTVATDADPAAARTATTEELVGVTVAVDGGSFRV